MTKLLFEIIREEFCDAVGEDGIDTSEAGRFCYGADYSWVSRAWVDRGMTPPVPDYVVFPRSTEEVSRVLKIANRYKIPVVPYAGGSGVNGGILALYGGVASKSDRTADAAGSRSPGPKSLKRPAVSGSKRL